MIYWAPLLHFYQPPTQVFWVLKKVCEESYRPLVELFHSLSHARVTININAALTELLYEHGMSDVIDGLRSLAERGCVEFTGSAKYHPILPLIPQEEVFRQIQLNHQTNSYFFGNSYSPRGFFSPEMCYSRDIVKPVADTGHRWLILSGLACPTTWPNAVTHEVSSDDRRLAVLFRDDILSNNISFRQSDAAGFINHLRQLRGNRKDIYAITAMDAETFGHHIKNWEKIFLREVYESVQPVESITRGEKQLQRLVDTQKTIFGLPDRMEEAEIKVVTLSSLLELFPSAGLVEPRPSSWSTSIDDIRRGDYYPLWDSRDHPLHRLQWQHLRIAIQLTAKAVQTADTDEANYYAQVARVMLDAAMHSDQFWWANPKPRWHMNLVNQGLMQQAEVVLNAYKAIKLSSNMGEDEKTKCYYLLVAANDLRNKIADQLLKYQ